MKPTLKERITEPMVKCLQENPDAKLLTIRLSVCADKPITTQDACKVLLKPFLKWAVQWGRVQEYAWIAEYNFRRQLSFNLMVVGNPDYKTLREKWNELQEKAGLLDQFKKTHPHADPLSIDIKIV